MHKRLVLIAATLFQPALSVAETHDNFQHLGEINKASIVMLTEEGLVPASLASKIAAGIERVIAEQNEDGAARSSNYLNFEARLLEIAGPNASRLHTGRSRQDIGSTFRRMALREATLDTYESLLGARQALLELATKHIDTIVPAYTHGVQAQPTTLAHYLLAFSAAFERDAQRLEEAYARLNLSPLGAAAFGTSGFAINRNRLAELLGFDAPVENSYDANLVSSVDSKIELANALSTSAITVGQLMQNLHTQYHNPVPWIQLAEETTDVSSIMPQKRNPRPLDVVRLLATAVVGSAHTVTLNAHNTNSGMNDYRPGTQAQDAANKAQAMYIAYAVVMNNLIVDRERALQEVEIDYSTMTEVADVLLRHADVPFRTGHHYASDLTTFGRANGKRPKDLTNDELLHIYKESIGEELPVDIELIRQAMDPAAMVRERKGLGGPQEAEVLRMLSRHNDSLTSERAWLDSSRSHLQNSTAALEQAFAELEQ
jgi:argininosuccinate lyase